MRYWLALAFLVIAFSAQAASEVSRFSVSAIVPGSCAITLTARGAVCAVTASAPSTPQPIVTLTRDATGLSVMTVEF